MGSEDERKFASLDELDEDYVQLRKRNGKTPLTGRLNSRQKWPSLSSLVSSPVTNVRTSFGDFVNILRSDSPGITHINHLRTKGQVSQEPPENMRAFIAAINDGNVKAFKQLHDELKGGGVDLTDESMHYEDGRNVLHLALGKSSEISKYIISVSEPQFLTEAYINFTGSTLYKTTALHMLLEEDDKELTEVFLAKLSLLAFWKQFDFLKSLTTINIGDSRVQLMTALHIAAMKGNDRLVRMLVHCGTTVDVVNESNETPLMWAVWGNHLETVRLLLSLGANANQEDDKGSTPLYWATRYGYSDMVHLFLTECNVNVNHRRKFGYALPLALASAAGRAKIVRDLLENGADAHMRGNGSKTSLHHAATHGHDHIIRILLEYKAEIDAVDEDGNTALMLATREARSLCVQTLLGRGADMNKKNKTGQTIWDFIIDSTGVNLLKMYIEIYKSVNHIHPGSEFTFSKGKSPVHIAAAKDDVGKVKCLLDLGLSWRSCDDMGNTFLHVAAKENGIQVLEAYANEFDEVIANDNGDTPLHVAVKYGNMEAVKLLLSRSSIGARNKAGSTPLHIAAWSDNETALIVRLLVQTIVACSNWALLDARDSKGNTPLHIAAKKARTDLIEELRALDARVTNTDGNNPLHVAALYGGPLTLETVIETFRDTPGIGPGNVKLQRYNLDQANACGDTLLHICGRQGDYDNVRILIEYGACLSARNVLGNTLLHELAEQSVLSPFKVDSFLKTYNVIVELSAFWWCKERGYLIPDEDSPLLAQHQRSAMLHLTSNISNESGHNAIMHCVHMAATSLLDAMMNTPRVYRISDEFVYHFDVTNLTPDTTVCTDSCEVTGHVARKSSVGSQKKNRLIHKHRESVLDVISNLSNEVQATKMLDIAPVKQMIKNYWAAYQLVYGFFMFVHIVYMTLYTNFGVATVDNDHNHNRSGISALDAHVVDHPHVFPAILLLIWPAFVIIFEIYYIVSAVRRYGWKNWSRKRACCSDSWFTVVLNLPYTIVTLLLNVASHFSGILFTLSVFLWFAFFMFSHENQPYILSVSLLLGWMFTISFAKGFQTVHSFSIILKHIFIRDITRFLFIYCFVMLGFALAFHVLFQMVPLLADRYHAPLDTFFMTLNVMLGLEDSLFEDFESSYSSVIVFIKITYVGYVMLSGIILFNLLIAMMSDTYANIISKEGTTWRLGSVRLALKIEHSFPFLKSAFKKFGIIPSMNEYNPKLGRWMMSIPKSEVVESKPETTSSESNNTLSRIENRVSELQATCQSLTYQMESLMRVVEAMTSEPDLNPVSRQCSLRHRSRRGSLQSAVQRWRNKSLLERRLSTEPAPLSPVSLIDSLSVSDVQNESLTPPGTEMRWRTSISSAHNLSVVDDQEEEEEESSKDDRSDSVKTEETGEDNDAFSDGEQLAEGSEKKTPITKA